MELYQKIISVILLSAVGSTIQRVSGFGFGIFVMMFFPLLVPYGQANALSGLLSLVSTFIVALTLIRKVHWKNLIFPVIGSSVLSLFAVIFMKSQTDTVLRLMLGVILLALSLFFAFFSDKIKVRPTFSGGLLAGCLSGVMNGLFAMGGPPVTVYYIQSEPSPEAYLATIQMYFAVTNLISTGYKASAGFVTVEVLILAACGIAGLFAGISVGKIVFDKLNAKTLRRVVYCFMAASGAVNIVTALVSIIKR